MANQFISTNANDQTIAEMYAEYLAGATLRLYAVATFEVVPEDVAWADLLTYAYPYCKSADQPTIGDAHALVVASEGLTWSVPITSWEIQNLGPDPLDIYGLLIADETNERILYFYKFTAFATLAVNAIQAFSFELWFDSAKWTNL
jgi:hypothetical protein